MRIKFYGILLLMLLLTCGMEAPSIGNCSQTDESQLKAVFVLNFAKLAEWPANMRAEGSTFTIAILGKMPSAGFINLLKGQVVRGAIVTVKHIDSVRQAKDAQLLYVSDSEHQRLPSILREICQFPILTVSDMPGFCDAGGMIGLVPVQNRLSFEINLSAVRKARLTVSSQLLKLAKNIIGN